MKERSLSNLLLFYFGEILKVSFETILWRICIVRILLNIITNILLTLQKYFTQRLVILSEIEMVSINNSGVNLTGHA
jgi:hypothetical protein